MSDEQDQAKAVAEQARRAEQERLERQARLDYERISKARDRAEEAKQR